MIVREKSRKVAKYIALGAFALSLYIWGYIAIATKELNPLRQPAAVRKLDGRWECDARRYSKLYKQIFGEDFFDNTITPQEDIDFWKRAGHGNELDKNQDGTISVREYLDFHQPHQRHPKLEDLEKVVQSYQTKYP